MSTSYVRDIKQLTAMISIKGVNYKISEGKANVNFDLMVSYGRDLSRLEFTKTIDVSKESIQSVEELLISLTTKLDEAFSRLKSPIEQMLRIAGYVEINLGELLQELSKELEIEVIEKKP